MPRYLNRGGDSNVNSYDKIPKGIKVKFNDGSSYSYTNDSAGANRVKYMKELAKEGEGLNSYINRKVRDDYESKE